MKSPCAGQTGKLKGMKKSNSEEVANRTGSEPCVVVRKDEGEASAGVRAGWVLSREYMTRGVSLGDFGVPTPWR